MASPKNTSELTDPLRSCRQGDHEAIIEVYKVVGRSLYGTAFRILKRPQEAEEAVQETFLRLLQKAHTIDSEHLVPWLRRVTVNFCLDRLRSKDSTAQELPATLPDTRPRDTGWERLDLTRAIADLPQRARLVFLLHDVEGFKHREIAQRLEINEGTSKAQLFRAREMLRRHLDPIGETTT